MRKWCYALLVVGIAGRVSGQAPDVADQTQEDVAVFRLLLDRELARAYGFPQVAHAWKVNDVFHHGVHQMPAAEGVYLKGVGVVYTVAAPPPVVDPLKAADAKAEPTPWEKARQELRGESHPQIRQPEGRPASVSEAVLRVLAENGRNFGNLAADERVTVAVTFRIGQNCTACHVADATSRATSYLLGVQNRDQEFGLYTRYDPDGPKRVATAPNDPWAQDLLLADLNHKQGKHAEAERAYLKVVTKLQEAKSDKPEARLRHLMVLGEVASKLAQVYVAQDKQDQAASMLKVARDATERAIKGAEDVKGAAPAARPKAPAQLVISATKANLDRVGSGKMTFEEFRKAATVELRGGAGKGGEKGKGGQ